MQQALSTTSCKLSLRQDDISQNSFPRNRQRLLLLGRQKRLRKQSLCLRGSDFRTYSIIQSVKNQESSALRLVLDASLLLRLPLCENCNSSLGNDILLMIEPPCCDSSCQYGWARLLFHCLFGEDLNRQLESLNSSSESRTVWGVRDVVWTEVVETIRRKSPANHIAF